MVYTINIEDLRLEAIVGVLDFEREKEQPLVVECDIDYERGDDETFVDYAEISGRIVNMLKNGQYFLLEDALLEIIEAIKADYTMITGIRLKICKPKILANCNVCVQKSVKY